MATTNGPETRSVWLLVKQEPLIHFLGLAAMLFVANAWLAADDKEVIAVDAETREYLLQARQDLLLRELTEEERMAVIEDFIEEEILTREARQRGFDNNSRIRSLLVQNMRFFLTQDVAAPSDDDLRRFYDENPERFMRTESVTYDHVFFEDPSSIPDGTLDALNRGADHRTMGDSLNLFARQLRSITRADLSQSFGPDSALEILAIDDDAWYGPYESGQGAHFLRVVELSEPVVLPYEEIENWVRNDWQLYMARKNVDDALVEYRRNYDIRLLEPGEEIE